MQENRYEGLRGNEVRIDKVVGKDITERGRITEWRNGAEWRKGQHTEEPTGSSVSGNGS